MTAQQLAVESDARIDFPIWGMSATLVVTDPTRLSTAFELLTAELAAIDAACSRFRIDSEINRVVQHPGRSVLSPLLNEVIGAALRVASATDYLVDPTVGAAVIALGYDRDVSQLVAASGVASPATGLADYSRPNSVPAGLDRVPAPGGWRIGHDAESRVMCLPSGVAIDLGASAKAFAADRAATQIAEQLRCGALVSLGGDVAVAGETPRGGWRVAIGESHRTAEQHRDDMVAITSGGLATSSIAVRRWRDPAGGTAHHIIDPRTGANPPACWRTVSAVAASCVDANAATTAAIVLGPQAPGWLRARRIPARLTGTDCSVVTVSGWPADRGGVGQDDGAGR